MTASRKLSEIAKTIRSKNAGVDKITFDVIFPDHATYERVRESGVLSRAAVCQIFGIERSQLRTRLWKPNSLLAGKIQGISGIRAQMGPIR
jgi:hypothetical protein